MAESMNDYMARISAETQRAVARMDAAADALTAMNRYVVEDHSGTWVYGRAVEDLEREGLHAALRANPAAHPLCRTCPNEMMCTLDPDKACRAEVRAEWEPTVGPRASEVLQAWITCGIYWEDSRYGEEEQHTWKDLARALYPHMVEQRRRANVTTR